MYERRATRTNAFPGYPPLAWFVVGLILCVNSLTRIRRPKPASLFHQPHLWFIHQCHTMTGLTFSLVFGRGLLSLLLLLLLLQNTYNILSYLRYSSPCLPGVSVQAISVHKCLENKFSVSYVILKIILILFNQLQHNMKTVYTY